MTQRTNDKKLYIYTQKKEVQVRGGKLAQDRETKHSQVTCWKNLKAPNFALQALVGLSTRGDNEPGGLGEGKKILDPEIPVSMRCSGKRAECQGGRARERERGDLLMHQAATPVHPCCHHSVQSQSLQLQSVSWAQWGRSVWEGVRGAVPEGFIVCAFGDWSGCLCG